MLRIFNAGFVGTLGFSCQGDGTTTVAVCNLNKDPFNGAIYNSPPDSFQLIVQDALTDVMDTGATVSLAIDGSGNAIITVTFSAPFADVMNVQLIPMYPVSS
jgi:hypothetical protein